MLKWFRPGPSLQQTALAMIGPKTGDRILVVGQPESGLAAELALVSGLNGQTLVANPSPAQRTAIEAAAAEAGALVEFAESLAPVFPGEASAQDLVILATRLADAPGEARSAWLTETFRVLRPGGRLVIVDGSRRKGLGFGPDKTAPNPAAEVVVGLMTGAGGVAARLLAAGDGFVYYEARKPR